MPDKARTIDGIKDGIGWARYCAAMLWRHEQEADRVDGTAESWQANLLRTLDQLYLATGGDEGAPEEAWDRVPLRTSQEDNRERITELAKHVTRAYGMPANKPARNTPRNAPFGGKIHLDD